MRPLPRGHGAPGGGASPAGCRKGERRRARDPRRPDGGDARRVDLRPRADGRERGRIRGRESGSAGVKITIDGVATEVEGGTILDACRRVGVDTPTLCYADTLTPVNVCRV